MTTSEQQQVHRFVQASLHQLLHQIIEACYFEVKHLNNTREYEAAWKWTQIAQRMTQTEEMARGVKSLTL